MTDTTHEAPDDLVERLRKEAMDAFGEGMREFTASYTLRGAIHDEAADRIEELQAENKNLRHMIIDQIEGAGDEPEIMAASRAEWAARAKAAEARIEELTVKNKQLEDELDHAQEWEAALLADFRELKAKLEKAVDLLKRYLHIDEVGGCERATFAELTGGNDD